LADETSDKEVPADENSSDDSSTQVPPLKVEISNPIKKVREWNDSRDDIEYEEIQLTKEDMDI